MKEHLNDLVGDITRAFDKYAARNAFVIDDISYTYKQLSETVHAISCFINSREDKVIGIIAENKLETYAAILAVLMSGRTYVILHPVYPKHRNKKIAQSAGIRLVLHTKDIRVLNLDTQNLELACTSDMQPNDAAATASPTLIAQDETAYILFTSGSTGEPKGVPISRRNLNAFYTAYSRLDRKSVV